MSHDNRYKPPERGAGDIAHTAARAVLGTVGSAAATELLNTLVAPPIERRRNEWMEQIGTALRELEKKETLHLESLQENEAFVDVAIQASQAALRTAHEEKREALRNAVVNAARTPSIDGTKAQMFVALIDSFSPWHLHLLALFSDPQGYIAQRQDLHDLKSDIAASSLSQLVAGVFPDLAESEELTKLIAADLDARGLAQLGNLKTMMSGHGILAKRTTTLGDEFLRFIQDDAV